MSAFLLSKGLLCFHIYARPCIILYVSNDNPKWTSAHQPKAESSNTPSYSVSAEGIGSYTGRKYVEKEITVE